MSSKFNKIIFKEILSSNLKLILIFLLFLLTIIIFVTFYWGWPIDGTCGKGFLSCYGLPIGKSCLGQTKWQGNIDCLPQK
jgi:hypothetical protein